MSGASTPSTTPPTIEFNKGIESEKAKVLVLSANDLSELIEGNYYKPTRVDSIKPNKLEEYIITPGVKVSLMEDANKPGTWTGMVVIDPTKVPRDNNAISFTLAGHRLSQDAQGKVQPNIFPDETIYKGLQTTPFDYYTNDAQKDPFLSITGPKTITSGKNTAWISKTSILCNGKYLPFLSLFVDFGTPGIGNPIVFPITVTINDKEGFNSYKTDLEKNNPGVNASLVVTGEVNANIPVKKQLFGKDNLPTFRVIKQINAVGNIFPNPARRGSNFTVPNIPENQEILWELIDISGKTVKSGREVNSSNFLEINTGLDLNSGNYIFRWRSKETGNIYKVNLVD